MITASSLLRLMNCPGSAVLPRAENHNVWADAGHSEHENLAQQLAEGVLPEQIARFIPAGSRTEVALAFDTATGVGRIVGENLARSYGQLGPFEVVGSADVMGVDSDAVVILDFKTGHAAVEPAETNPQLQFYCLAAARALGKSRAIARIYYTQIDKCDEAEFSALDLAQFAQTLVDLHTHVARQQKAKTSSQGVSTREGSWCKHCASKHVCPSKVGLLMQLAAPGLAVIGDAVMTREKAAGAYEQIVRVEQLVKEARKRLETYVDEQGPIDLGGGRMFGRYVRTGNERLSGDVAVRAIREVVSESAKEFEKLAIERSTSKAAIERAAKALAPKRGASKMTAAVVAKIRELGGATRLADSMPLGEYTRGKDEPAEVPALDVEAVNKLLAEAG